MANQLTEDWKKLKLMDEETRVVEASKEDDEEKERDHMVPLLLASK